MRADDAARVTDPRDRDLVPSLAVAAHARAARRRALGQHLRPENAVDLPEAVLDLAHRGDVMREPARCLDQIAGGIIPKNKKSKNNKLQKNRPNFVDWP